MAPKRRGLLQAYDFVSYYHHFKILEQLEAVYDELLQALARI